MRFGEVELAIIDIITFIGLLITFLTGVLNLLQNKKTLYINNITRFRVVWITTLRTHIASLKELSNITNLHIRTKEGTNKVEFRRELDRVVSMIKMHLNFTGAIDSQLICKVEELKTILNSFLFIYYCKNTIESVKNDEELAHKFNQVIDVISEKKLLRQLLDLAICHEYQKERNLNKNITLLELKNEVKLTYRDNLTLIKQVISESDNIINNYENEIENLNDDIDEIIQIYLKAEWIRCKIETRMWPYNKYNEEKVIKKLQKDYKRIKEYKKIF